MLNVPYPYYLCSAEQCRRMDERTIREFGIDGFTLMEVAGTRAADFILSRTEPGAGLFLCGKGNNAGDALVAARILSEKEYSVSICFVAGDDDLSTDTRKNLDLLRKLDGHILFIDKDELKDLTEYDFIVDGLLGTGLSSEVREPMASVIQSVNDSGTTVFSMDLPSGLHADTGRIMGVAVHADFTLSFGALKAGFYLNEGFEYSGEIVLCELPFPNQFKEAAAYLIDEAWAEKLTHNKPQRRHKYDGGVVYLIAGSAGLTGAAILAAKSAWSAGVGAVILITPRGLMEVYEKNLPQIIKKPVGTKDDEAFSAAHANDVLSILQEKPGKVLIGPGLGRDQDTQDFVSEVLSNAEYDFVIDADALFALAGLGDWNKPPQSRWILTPHPGELSTLLNSDMNDAFDRMIKCCQKAKQEDVTILSKGFPSIVGTSEGKAYLTGYDTRVFSRAGFGDVLAGKTVAFFIQENHPTLACIRALLDGKRKAGHTKNSGVPEPLDII